MKFSSVRKRTEVRCAASNSGYPCCQAKKIIFLTQYRETINLEGHQNCILSLKVMAILLNLTEFLV